MDQEEEEELMELEKVNEPSLNTTPTSNPKP